MARDAQDMGRQSIMRRFVESRTVGPPEMTKDEELFVTHAKTMKMQRCQHMNLMWSDQNYSIVMASDYLIAKVKIKSSQRHKCANLIYTQEVMAL